MRRATALLFVLAACDPSSAEPANPADTPSVAGKADGFGENGFIDPLALDATVEGQAAGGAVRLYRLEAAAGSVLSVEIERTSGDLEPQAFLYRDLADLGSASTFVRPDRYDPSSDAIGLSWELDQSTPHILVVHAADETAGRYALSVDCEGLCEIPPENSATFDEWTAQALETTPDDWGDLETVLDTREVSDGAGHIHIVLELVDLFDLNGFDIDDDATLDAILDPATTYEVSHPDGRLLGFAIGTQAVIGIPEDCRPGDDCGIETAEHVVDAAVFMEVDGNALRVAETVFVEQ